MISVDPLTRRFNSQINSGVSTSNINKIDNIINETQTPVDDGSLRNRVQSLENNLAIVIKDMIALKSMIDELKNGISAMKTSTNISENINTENTSFLDNFESLNRKFTELETRITNISNSESFTTLYETIATRVTDLETKVEENLFKINKSEETAPKKTARRGIKLKAPSAE